MKKCTYLILALVMSLLMAGSACAEAVTGTEEEGYEEGYQTEDEEGYEYEEVFAEWYPDAPALNTLIDFVEDVTDENSENFIPQVDRIATFDMDGTLYAELFPTYIEYYMLAWRILEDPRIQPDEEMLALGRELRDSVISKSFAEDLPIRHAIQAARAYSNLTLEEFSDFVTEILLRDADGFEGMTYGEAFYLPMLEVIEYLADNGFKVYICSGSDRFICRTLFEGIVDIPDEQIIGMDVDLEAREQGDVDGLDYVFTASDEVIRSDRLLIKNLKMNKVRQIAQEIGRCPVLSFGNSSGDTSMHNYALSNKTYKSAAFMLIADDEERDYGNTEKCIELRQKWEDAGYNVISMKNDWRTIYGEQVVKTGTFRWEAEMAEERTAAETFVPQGATAAQAAEAAQEQAEEAAEETSEEQAGEAGTYYVTANKLNVRADASTDGKIVGALYQGDEVQVTGAAEGDAGWVQISYEGADAYVSAEFLSEEKPAA